MNQGLIWVYMEIRITTFTAWLPRASRPKNKLYKYLWTQHCAFAHAVSQNNAKCPAHDTCSLVISTMNGGRIVCSLKLNLYSEGPNSSPAVKWKEKKGNITTALKDHDRDRKDTEKMNRKVRCRRWDWDKTDLIKSFGNAQEFSFYPISNRGLKDFSRKVIFKERNCDQVSHQHWPSNTSTN